MSLSQYLILAGVLFAIGAVIILVRRSMIISLVGIEFMLNSANLVFVTFARTLGDVNGETMAFFAIIAAAVEVVVGLAVTASIFKSRSMMSVNDANLLKS